jgi:hypothetical protein
MQKRLARLRGKVPAQDEVHVGSATMNLLTNCVEEARATGRKGLLTPFLTVSRASFSI